MPQSDPVPASVLAEVANAAAVDAGGLDAALLGDFLSAVAVAVTRGSRLSARQVRAYQAQGLIAARQGVALRALLDLYLSAAWRLWRHLPIVQAADDAEAIITAGEVVLRAVDDSVASLTEGYQLARRDLIRVQEAARREFIDDLLSGQAGIAGLLERAGRFGLDLAGPHAVIAGQADQLFADGTPVLSQLERAVQGSKGDSEALLTTKQGLLIVVFAAPDRAAVAQVVSAVTSVLGKAKITGWQLGVGRARPGADGVLASYEEARDVLELTRRLALNEAVVEAADMLIYRVLLRDRVAIADLVTTMLSPLTQARGGAQPLLLTLSAYFDAGSNSALAARTLHLSARALTYRLERVKQLTGHDPTRPDHRFALHAAVLAARLLNWPADPLS